MNALLLIKLQNVGVFLMLKLMSLYIGMLVFVGMIMEKSNSYTKNSTISPFSSMPSF